MTMLTVARSSVVSAPLALGLFALLGGVSLSACGGPNEYMVAGSGPAAGADAEVSVERMEGSTTKLVKINMKHLPPPERVSEGLTTYVVWFTAEDEAPTKAGRLAFDAETREGTLQATSAHENFTVVVTAEETEHAAAPSSHVVLSQAVE